MHSMGELCARVLRLGSGEGGAEASALTARLGSPGAERLIGELSGRSPALAEALSAEVGDFALANLQRFLIAASTGEERMRTTLENSNWVERALPVFAHSALATNILARHPEDIVALFQDCEVEAGRSISDELRIEARRCILRLVGRTLLNQWTVWEVLRAHSQSLEEIVRRALAAVAPPEGFAVTAVGRLGTCELDVVSDADLVFLRDSECDPEAAERCARSLVAMLSGYTREGSVIAADMRIRPHGSEGELVVSSRQLAQYFESEAQAWETLAFGKLRWVAGAKSLADEAAEALLGLRKRFAASAQFVSELRATRKRLADSGGADSFKTGPGGMYDLDYLLGLLETRAALPAAGMQQPERLDRLISRNLFRDEQAAELRRALDLFRCADHAVRVVEGRSRKWLPESSVLLRSVEKTAGYAELDRELRAEMPRVRAIFDSFFHD
jgi:glutamine synthetase adenylyltransferase